MTKFKSLQECFEENGKKFPFKVDYKNSLRNETTFGIEMIDRQFDTEGAWLEKDSKCSWLGTTPEFRLSLADSELGKILYKK